MNNINKFEKLPYCRENYACTLIAKTQWWKKLFSHSGHPPYFIICSVFKESHIELRQLEFNTVLDTDLSRFHKTQVIYLTGKVHSNLICVPKLCTIFLFPDTTVILPVWIKISYEYFMTSNHSRKQNRCFQEAETPSPPPKAHFSIMTMVLIPKNHFSAHCDSLVCCSLPFDTRAGINFYLISDRYHHCRQPFLIVFILNGLN